MKIIVIGGTGLIGEAVVKELGKSHDIIIAARKNADIEVDLTSLSSVQAMFKKANSLDAVIATTGKVRFEDFSKMDTEKYLFGLHNKLIGQVNLVLIGRDYMNEGGSFTLTSGVLCHDPIRAGSSGAMVNGAIDGFVKAAAIEMPKKIRINSVSPTIVTEATQIYENFFKGFQPVPVAQVALAYVKSVESLQTGQIYKVGYC